MLKSNPKELNALSLSLDFEKRLAASDLDFKIHSLYQRVINLVDQNGEIFSILLKSLDNGPHSMRIDSELSFKKRKIKKTDQVKISPQKIIIADKLVINLKNYQLFESRLDQKIKLKEKIIKQNLKLAAQIMNNQGKTGGAKYFYQKNFENRKKNSKTDINSQKALTKILTIEREFAKRAEKYILAAEKRPEKLIGFGMGLTPTGDDFLTGYFLTMAALDDDYAAENFNKLKSVLEKIEISTTDISREMILRALELKTRENIKNLIFSFNQNTKKLKLYLAEVLKIGSSSGTDILAGIMTAYQEILAKKMEGKNVF